MLVTRPIEPVTGDLPRRWMTDDYFDLIVWYDSDGRVHGFQLCYDKPGRERALTWTWADGARHGRIDTGEYDPRANRTPVLIPESGFPADAVKTEFVSRSAQLTEPIRTLVLSTIVEFASRRGPGDPNPDVEACQYGGEKPEADRQASQTRRAASQVPRGVGARNVVLVPADDLSGLGNVDSDVPREWVRLAVSLLVAVLIVGAVAILLSVSFQREALRYFFGR